MNEFVTGLIVHGSALLLFAVVYIVTFLLTIKILFYLGDRYEKQLDKFLDWILGD